MKFVDAKTRSRNLVPLILGPGRKVEAGGDGTRLIKKTKGKEYPHEGEREGQTRT